MGIRFRNDAIEKPIDVSQLIEGIFSTKNFRDLGQLGDTLLWNRGKYPELHAAFTRNIIQIATDCLGNGQKGYFSKLAALFDKFEPDIITGLKQAAKDRGYLFHEFSRDKRDEIPSVIGLFVDAKGEITASFQGFEQISLENLLDVFKGRGKEGLARELFQLVNALQAQVEQKGMVEHASRKNFEAQVAQFKIHAVSRHGMHL